MRSGLLRKGLRESDSSDPVTKEEQGTIKKKPDLIPPGCRKGGIQKK